MRLVIAEDAALLREGLSLILTNAGHRVRAVADADGLLAAVAAEAPDAVITDIRMPPDFRDEGLHAALRLRRDLPGLPILVLSQYVEHTYAAELVSLGGGVGYLLKDKVGDIPEFLAALDRVAAGGTVVDPDVVRRFLEFRRMRAPLERLTPRERDVLALIAEGRSNSTIARGLRVTDAAIAKHVNNILSKLDLPPDTDGHRRVLAVLAYLQHDHDGF
ncbi:two component transcriptional regulator, LuxR family [Glycomyces sambucus]|uniref:Two component transcriptional regulator, LuxR family n=1 Tax=Glycomyces sambucus TaxID=380244 RepID=A0A1G9FWF5_9ACTN|nr:response regulator transcription factor [Glycomyces sambucus]SDK92724.1 two component transcriptional regulator, LuxR family [Glycomyces sambucus]